MSPTLQTRVGTGIRSLAGAATRRAAGLSTHTARVGELSVTYDEGGDAGRPTVVMLHGFSADRDVWGRFAGAMRDFHVLIPDLAGHGHSTYTRGAGYSAPAQADRVVAFLDALGSERAHIIGNSMGGFITATVGRRAPERVASLALVDAAGVRSPELSVLERMLERGENPFLMEDVSQFDAFYAMTMAKMPFVPAIVRRAIGEDYVTRRDALAEIFADFHGQDLLTDHLSEIAAPTWIAWGRQDQLIHVSATGVWAGGLPRASVTIYDDLGHMPMLEAPRRLARDYRSFLDRVAAEV